MTTEELYELLAVGRGELAHALRQWKMYADEKREDYHELGDGTDLEDRYYKSGREVLRRLGAAADELDDASTARKTAFAPAHSWAAEERRIRRAALCEVLDRNLEESGTKITVRRYNKILTDLGYHLDEPPNIVVGDSPKI